MRSPLIQNSIGARPPLVERGDGVWLYDTDGRRYFDGSSGAVVSSIGHGDRRVVAAIAEQAAKVAFSHRGAFSSRPLEAVAARLTALTGYAGAWFVSSGSEAVEAAMQLAHQYFVERGEPQRDLFLSHDHGYHGNTLGALSLSGHARRVAAGGLVHDFTRLSAPYPSRDQGARSEDEYARALLDHAAEEIARVANSLAAVVIEPVGGATLGATVPPRGYIPGLRQLCDRAGVLLIADEVMTGMGRTGTVLAMDHEGVKADIVALGKGLGAGYTPIAATLLSESVLSALESGCGRIPGGHTYGGNPLSAATALAVLGVFESDDVISHGARAGAQLAVHLQGLAAAHRSVVDVRGRGMLWAFEFDSAPDGTVGERSRLFASIAARRGAILYPATGGYNDAVLVAPPLVTTDTEIEQLAAILDAALTDFDSAVDQSLRAEVVTR